MEQRKKIVRVQTGIRIEKNILKVLKGTAAELELSLSDLLEGIILHAFEGKQPFSEKTLEFIDTIRHAYGLELSADDSHKLIEQ